MSKTVRYILLITTLLMSVMLAGCSSPRRGFTEESGKSITGDENTVSIGDISTGNISDDGFFITRMRIELLMDGSRDRFTVNIRKSASGKWLASVRSLLGIEFVRVYGDEGGVVVLERIGRVASVYSWEQLFSDYGLSYDLLPVLFGDIPKSLVTEDVRINCYDYTYFNYGGEGNGMIKPDCTVLRSAEITLRDSSSGREVIVETVDYDFLDNRAYPSSVKLSVDGDLFSVFYTIDGIVFPWDGEIGFSIPGNYFIRRSNM